MIMIPVFGKIVDPPAFVVEAWTLVLWGQGLVVHN